MRLRDDEKWVSAGLVRKLFDYISATGKLVWKFRRPATRRNNIFNAKYAGKEAGSKGPRHSRVTFSDGDEPRTFLTHRVIWLYMTGHWPKEGIDHRDGDGMNNRWRNLREANQSQNAQNRKLRSDNPFGHTGVYAKGRKFVAVINGRRLGKYDTIDEAAEAYKAAKVRLHPFQPRLRES
jgi:HNH endonuclease